MIQFCKILSFVQFNSLIQNGCFTGWHPNIRIKQNHPVHNDAPWFIMESCLECRHSPRLFLLDKQELLIFLLPQWCSKVYYGILWIMRSSPAFVLTWQARTIEFLIILPGSSGDTEKLLILLCRFNNDGAGTCLKRLLDPSCFKMACSSQN